MTTAEKRTPSYTDTDLMPFGKYRGTTLQDVPAAYLAYLWSQRPMSDKALENYVFNSKDAIEQEIGEAI